jgi:hypothetical protein
MATGELKGRLVSGGIPSRLYVAGEDGILDDDAVEVAWDADKGGYVAVKDGEPSHNERHGTGQQQLMSGTTGPLYDENGVLVFEGDPNHGGPNPDEPLAGTDPDNPDKHRQRMIETYDPVTGEVTEEPEYGDPTITGHTEAYTNG